MKYSIMPRPNLQHLDIALDISAGYFAAQDKSKTLLNQKVSTATYQCFKSRLSVSGACLCNQGSDYIWCMYHQIRSIETNHYQVDEKAFM